MQIEYKNIIMDVKQGTPVNQLLSEEIRKAKCKIIACKFIKETIFERKLWLVNGGEFLVNFL